MREKLHFTIFIMMFSMICVGVRLPKGTLIGLKELFLASMRGWSNEDSIFENENLKCHFIFMFSGLKLGVYGLILVLKIFVNVASVFLSFWTI